VQFDHTSVLKLIEWRWGLAPLTVRDSSANNLAYALDFAQPNNFAPLYSVPIGPFGAPCASALPSEEESEWATLQSLARSLGFPLL
jgi:phospholipase C